MYKQMLPDDTLLLNSPFVKGSTCCLRYSAGCAADWDLANPARAKADTSREPVPSALTVCMACLQVRWH